MADLSTSQDGAPPAGAMWRPRRNVVAARVAAVVCSLLAIMMAASVAIAVASHQMRSLEVSQVRGASLAALVADAPPGLRTQYLQAGAKVFKDSNVVMLDARGGVLARGGADRDFPRPETALEALELAKSGGGTLQQDQGATQDVVLPVPDAGSRGAYLVIARVPAVGAGTYGPATALIMLAVGLILAALGYVLARAFAQRITRPLREIAEAAHNMSTRHLAVNVSVRTGDEIEAVALAFNRMCRRLEVGMERLRKASSVDSVTDLPNRQRFVLDVAQALAARKPSQEPSILILLDLARFRQINEAIGRSAGDEVLAIAAERLSEALKVLAPSKRADDLGPAVLSRLGADEFGIFIPALSKTDGASALMKALISALSAPIIAGGQKIFLSASAGAAICSEAEADPERLISHAQAALDHGRAQGFGLGLVYSEGMGRKARSVFAAETALRDAIASKAIVPYFQPKVDLTSGKITSAEALARWIVPNRGVMEPGRFIAAAERLGLIGMLGESILRQACEAAAAWQRMGLRCRVAVNVAPAQFDDPGFVEKVLLILDETKLAPDVLELEITESTAMKDPVAVARQIAPLRKAGVRLSLDDFGAGHSSLAMLTQLPFDVFKIDRSFVSALDTDEQAAAVVETILTLARSLNFETVAEGIENVRQEAFLRKRGCTLGQGYYYSKPVPLPDFLSMAQNAGRRVLRAVG